ncbi:TIGR03086 family metal-binding protein [Microlunatus speluncae]|uniref:TIGR03086 family metal-binding protein n=1 Tax=Microlunatus speluncae TaxID=2594267 RepID=UPI00126671B0|nr:TIGR03086 family metal-binding protein [Microlunatus speluncae]
MITGIEARPVAPILSGSVRYALTAVAGLSADDLGRSSPCAGWTVGDVLRHLHESFDALSAALNFGRVVLDEPSGASPREGVISALTESADCLDRAARRRGPASPIAVGGLPLARDKVIIVASVEAAVHGWDVSAGAGRPLPIPDPLAIALHGRLPELGSPGPGIFGPALTISDASTPSRRLLADLGRDWRFDAGLAP